MALPNPSALSRKTFLKTAGAAGLAVGAAAALPKWTMPWA